MREFRFGPSKVVTMLASTEQTYQRSQQTIIEPRHDKTNKMSVRPAKTRISLGIRPVWSVFAVRSMDS